MDLPVMAHWWLPAVLAGISPRQLPVVELSYSSQGDSIRTQGALKFAQPVPLQLEAWRFPTNSVRDPLVAFTAVQGIRDAWNDSRWTQTFEMKPAPNQIFIWSQAKLPFLTFAACPATDVTNSLRRASATLPALIMSSLGAHKTGKFVFNASRSEISWTELPLFHPFLHPAVEPNGQFLLGGIYPSIASNPPPQELISQVVGRTNLVYYDWEITQERLAQESIVLPLMNAVLASKLKLDFGTERTNSYIQPWLKALGPLLGNTITEATAGSNREIAFVRRSHLGLTSLELVFLAHWLDDPGFPLFGYALPVHDKAPTPAGGGGQTSKRP